MTLSSLAGMQGAMGCGRGREWTLCRSLL